MSESIQDIVRQLKEMALPDPPILGVYFLLFGGQIVYIGFSTDIAYRIATHRNEFERLASQDVRFPSVVPKRFDEVRYIEMPDEKTGLHLEGLLIAAIRPKYNRLGRCGYASGKKC